LSVSLQLTIKDSIVSRLILSEFGLVAKSGQTDISSANRTNA